MCTQRRQLRSEHRGRICGATEADGTPQSPRRQQLAWLGLEGRRRATQDKGTGPQGPVMAVPGQQIPYLQGVRECQTLMQN